MGLEMPVSGNERVRPSGHADQDENRKLESQVLDRSFAGKASAVVAHSMDQTRSETWTTCVSVVHGLIMLRRPPFHPRLSARLRV